MHEQRETEGGSCGVGRIPTAVFSWGLIFRKRLFQMSCFIDATESQSGVATFPVSQRVSVAEGSFRACSFVHSCLCAWPEHKPGAIVSQEAKKL